MIKNEVDGLIRANKCNIPRVVKYQELTVLPNGDVLVVLEYVVCDQSGMLTSMNIHHTVPG